MQRPVQPQHRHARLQLGEHLGEVLGLFARGQEHNDLLPAVGLEEAPEDVDLVLDLGHDVALAEILRRGHARILVHGDEDGVGEGEARQVRDVAGLGGGEEQSLALGGDAAHDAVDGRGEAEVQTPVRLVQHQQLQVVDVEGGVLVEVLQQAAGGADEDVAVRHPRPLELEILAADDEAGAEVVLLAHQPQRLEDLIGELPGGCDDQRPRPVISAPPRAVELLQDGN